MHGSGIELAKPDAGPGPAPPGAFVLPELPVLLIALAAGLLWILLLAVLGGLVTGVIPGPDALFPALGPESPIRWAIFAQMTVQFLVMSATLVLGTAGAALYFAGQLPFAARVLRILVWVLLVVALVGPFVAAGPTLAMSRSLMAALPAMLVTLPMMPVHIAMLLIADRALSRAGTVG